MNGTHGPSEHRLPGGFMRPPKKIYHEIRPRQIIEYPQELPERDHYTIVHPVEPLHFPKTEAEWKRIEKEPIKTTQETYTLKLWQESMWIPQREVVVDHEDAAQPTLHLYGHWRTHLFRVWVKDKEQGDVRG